MNTPRRLARFLLALTAATCAFAADLGKDAKARQLVLQLGFPAQFEQSQADYLEFMRGDKVIPPTTITWLGQRLAQKDYATPLGNFVAARFEESELDTLAAYFGSAVAQRELALARTLEKEVIARGVGAVDFAARQAAFLDGLTATERKLLTDFRQSAAGRKFWGEYANLQNEYQRVFSGLTRRLIDVELSAKIAEESAREKLQRMSEPKN